MRIITDSSSDLTPELIERFKVDLVIPMKISIDGKEYLDKVDIQDEPFYHEILPACQSLPKTSQVTANEFCEIFSRYPDEELVVLPISSGLSGTYNAGALAVRELSERYPQRKVYAVDTLCASLGQGMLVYLCCMKRREGATIEEVRDYAEATKLHLCHWFTVDDLMFLKRGGRVSAATAIVGSMLSIKPVMHVDDEGHLIKVDTARGRKASIRALVAEMEKRGIDLPNQHLFISHGDCEDDANYLAKLIREKFPVKDITINYVGPVIGAHSGPGTLALFFLGNKR